MEPIMESDRDGDVEKQSKTNRVTLIVIMVLLAVVIIVIVVVAIVLALGPNSAAAAAKKKAALQENPKDTNSPLKLFGATLPVTISSTDRLIIRASKSNSFLSTYFIYKYPPGTYATLDDLVTALNTANNFEAIYFDSTNRIWFVNDFLVWGSSSGKLTVTWTDTFYDTIRFFRFAPFQDPAFTVSDGTSGINDSNIQPNWIHLIDTFSIPTTEDYTTNQTIDLAFP